MLTTSRREVSVDRYDRFSSAKDNREYADELNIGRSAEAPSRRRASFFADDAQDEEYTMESIKSKLLGKERGNGAYEEDADISGETSTPSPYTLEYRNLARSGRNISDAKVIVHSMSKTKAKIAVASYIAVVLILAIAIAFTAASVSGAFAQTAVLDNEITEQGVTMEGLAEELSTVNEAALIEMAQSLGYSLPNSGNTFMYDTPQMRDPQTFELTTNWFDKLCDGLCSLFGGN